MRIGEHRERAAPRLATILFLCICLLFLVHVWAYNFVCDDTFITLRYARNLATGNGLVFNPTPPPHERVEGFSSPLWTLLLAGLGTLGIDLLTAARLLGIIAALLTLWLTYRLAKAISLPPFAALLAPALLAANGSFACWSASGMETPVYMCLLVASLLFVYVGSAKAAILSTIMLILVRPEAGLFSLLLTAAVYALREEGRGRRMRIWLAACGASVVVLLAARLLYYGNLLPNTYFAKVGGGLHAYGRGLQYLLDDAEDHEGLILLCVPVVYGFLLRNLRPRFLALATLLLWLMTILEGGDGQPMYRMALPALPFLVVLDARLFADACHVVAPYVTDLPLRRLLIGAAVLLWGTVLVTVPIVGTYYVRYQHHKDVEVPEWTEVGKWLKANARPGDSVAAVPIGAVSYYSGLTAIDMMGLTDAHIAHVRMPHMGEGWAGHEKHDGQYVLRRRPTYLLVGNIDVTEKPRDPGQVPFIPYYSAFIWAREGDLYATDLLSREYVPRSALICPGKYLNFYELRDELRAPSRTTAAEPRAGE
jgi:arabinofuranosyltransferase